MFVLDKTGITLARFRLFLTDTECFQKILHYYPIRGHSYIACDRNFSVWVASRDKKGHFSISKCQQFVYKSDLKGAIGVFERIEMLVNHTFHFQLAVQRRPIVKPTNKSYNNGNVPIKRTKLEVIRKYLQYVAVHDEATKF
ncbi:hypothetical protein PR048_019740 [Dryococelus australis]|uniref:PiggyBac transposable element-derived protein domain-containing protein n=1 Tax=Dryococelus australis TaxID=614101 RepID=A0ABQ9H4A6_9NEOP|nr:hypothetical protein PR048_019740 [Dryococelus australis]